MCKPNMVNWENALICSSSMHWKSGTFWWSSGQPQNLSHNGYYHFAGETWTAEEPGELLASSWSDWCWLIICHRGSEFHSSKGVFPTEERQLGCPICITGRHSFWFRHRGFEGKVFLLTFTWLLAAAPVDRRGQTCLVVIRVMLPFSDAIEEQVSRDGLWALEWILGGNLRQWWRIFLGFW